MSTLDARYVRRPRASRCCDYCGKPLASHIRLYGMADREPPWTLRLHVGCVGETKDEKIRTALKKASEA